MDRTASHKSIGRKTAALEQSYLASLYAQPIGLDEILCSFACRCLSYGASGAACAMCRRLELADVQIQIAVSRQEEVQEYM